MGYDNKVIARRFFDEVMSKGNYALLDELAARDLLLQDPGFPEGRGHEYLKEQLNGFRTGLPDLRFQINDIFVAEDRAVVRWTASGTHRGTLMGIDATGKHVAVSGCDVLTMSDGKIQEDVSYWDTYGFIQQLGLVPNMGELGQVKPKQPATNQPAQVV